MVSFLILKTAVVGVLVIGLFYAFASDTIDSFIPFYSSGPMSAYNTEESNWGFDVVVFAFKYVLISALVGLMFYSYLMAQKPEQPWR